jgi:hypothetical protein
MGAIRDEQDGTVHVLEAHHLIGRSHRSSLRLEDPSVSGEHASLRWTGRTWVIKDLGSRYGTFLDSAPLQPGVPATVKKGSRMAFGRDKRTWVMSDVEAPQVMVLPEGGGPALLQNGGMIAIPSVEHPAAVLFQGITGEWLLEQEGQAVPIHENVTFLVEGRRWRLANASPSQETSKAGEGLEIMSLAEVRLKFLVSRNEEHVELEAHWRDRVIRLDARSHHYVLLTLARIRQRDVQKGESSASAGWIAQDELANLLQFAPERLNLDIFRARRQFGAEGFFPPASIVERRPAARELRLGVSQVEIEVA